MEESAKTGVLFEVTDADIQSAKAAFPNVGLFVIEADTDSGESFSGIFRRPDVASIQKYLVDVGNDKDAGVRASAVLAANCIVVPTKEVFFDIQKRFALLSIGLANELYKGFGSVRASKKKLI